MVETDNFKLQKIVGTDNWRSIFSIHNSTVDKIEAALVGVALSPADPFPIPAENGSVTYAMDGITSEHVLSRWRFSASADNNPPCDLTWTTYNGYFTITNNSGTTAETIQPIFTVPALITATEQEY